MRLPAVTIAAAFACGIVLGLHPAAVHHAASANFLFVFLFLATLFVLTGIILIKFDRILLSAVSSLLSWVLLGFLSAVIAEQPRALEHVSSLLERGSIELKAPLRWRGVLRDEPTRLPWGWGYEIELSGVEFEGALHTARGGLRLSFAPHAEGELPPALHAGDEVSVLTEAQQPQVFKDEGAFDRRAYLAQQNIDLVATLRASELIERLAVATPTASTRLARVRRRLRDEIDDLFGAGSQTSGVLRAMLLGDRSFVDHADAADFQKTGVFHVLVVAGLHVGALAFALYWMGRKLRLSPAWTALFTLLLLFAYVAVVEQRPPVLRAAMMASIVVLGGFFFRRLDLLNSAAVAALVLLVAKPLALRDSSFQLTFVAIGCIAGLAAPWLEKRVQPYVRALRGWRDVTRDAAHEPRGAVSHRSSFSDAVDFWATATTNRSKSRRNTRWGTGLGVALGRITGGDAGAADGNAAADGARLSPDHAFRAAGESRCGAVDGRGCAVGIFDGNNGTPLPRTWKNSSGAAHLGHPAAGPRRAVVRELFEWELPHSWAVCVGDYGLFCFCAACGRSVSNKSPNRQKHCARVVAGLDGERAGGGDLPVCPEMGSRKTGSLRPGCGTGRFFVRSFSQRQDDDDRWRRRFRRVSRT